MDGGTLESSSEALDSIVISSSRGGWRSLGSVSPVDFTSTDLQMPVVVLS